eukprot:CAMPEP_0197718542 /NCGR_PEP_ID=MMETSP1434-20131217/2662_1 /TAXON_ID=265543 /ORGANISM="Minutocellus polymorphus, Strain CCMP3303" /LENGTH=148 /DNA_ID=CAMNT_0043303215 /DNA_START=164 /DNA_END=608 /DNA_ORIENTATION=-
MACLNRIESKGTGAGAAAATGAPAEAAAPTPGCPTEPVKDMNDFEEWRSQARSRRVGPVSAVDVTDPGRMQLLSYLKVLQLDRTLLLSALKTVDSLLHLPHHPHHLLLGGLHAFQCGIPPHRIRPNKILFIDPDQPALARCIGEERPR